ncbi:hypothetical protein SRIMM317S_03073 [Streptomyces rimosus subsp. rimosus]
MGVSAGLCPAGGRRRRCAEEADQRASTFPSVGTLESTKESATDRSRHAGPAPRRYETPLGRTAPAQQRFTVFPPTPAPRPTSAIHQRTCENRSITGHHRSGRHSVSGTLSESARDLTWRLPRPMPSPPVRNRVRVVAVQKVPLRLILIGQHTRRGPRRGSRKDRRVGVGAGYSPAVPVEFLTDEQAEAYGTFTEVPTRPEPERFFFLDDDDRDLTALRRSDARNAVQRPVSEASPAAFMASLITQEFRSGWRPVSIPAECARRAG